jgi:SAM-dependent methyltransferase
MAGAGNVSDTWERGDPYERYIGRWSRQMAPRFLSWLGLPPGRRWLDVGCGTGALTGMILAVASPSQVDGVDASPDYAAYARQQVPDPRVRFEVGEAGALPVASESYDAVVSGLVLNFLPEPARGVAEMARAARAGGVVAAYVWDYADGMQFLRVFWDVAVELDPGAGALDEGRRFPLCRREALAELFEHQGLRSIETRALEVTTAFADFAGYWNPFLGGTGPAPSYVASLGEDAREQLRRELSERLAPKDGDPIRLAARAWAVRGARAVPPDL